jgi:hypothetical protein
LHESIAFAKMGEVCGVIEKVVAGHPTGNTVIYNPAGELIGPILLMENDLHVCVAGIHTVSPRFSVAPKAVLVMSILPLLVGHV